MTKNKIILIIIIAILITSSMLYILKLNPWVPILLGVIIVPLIYALWEPPKKHKNYSYSDQQKATSRALGGSGSPDLPKPPSGKRK